MDTRHAAVHVVSKPAGGLTSPSGGGKKAYQTPGPGLPSADKRAARARLYSPDVSNSQPQSGGTVPLLSREMGERVADDKRNIWRSGVVTLIYIPFADKTN